MGLHSQMKRKELLVLLLLCAVGRLSFAAPDASQGHLEEEYPGITLLEPEAEASLIDELTNSEPDKIMKRWINFNSPAYIGSPQMMNPRPVIPQGCPTTCVNQVQQPICGTDGRDYASPCDLRMAACVSGKNIQLRHTGRCLKCAFGYQYYDINSTIKVLGDHCMKILCILDSKLAPGGGIVNMAKVHVRYDDTACGCCYYGRKRFETGNQISAGCFRLVCFSGSWIPVPRINQNCGRCTYYNHEHILPFSGHSYTWGTPCESIMVQSTSKTTVPYKLNIQTSNCRNHDHVTCLHKVTYYENNETVAIMIENDNLQVYVNHVRFVVHKGPASLIYEVAEKTARPILAWRHRNGCLRFVGTYSLSFQVCPDRLDVFITTEGGVEYFDGLCRKYHGGPRSSFPQHNDSAGGPKLGEMISDQFGLSWKDPTIPCNDYGVRYRHCKMYQPPTIGRYRSSCVGAVERARYNNMSLPAEVRPHYIASCKVDMCTTRGNNTVLADLERVYQEGIDLFRGSKGMCHRREPAYQHICLDNRFGLRGKLLIKKRLNSPLFGKINKAISESNMKL